MTIAEETNVMPHTLKKDATLVALKMEEGPPAKKCRWPLEAGKGKERILS